MIDEEKIEEITKKIKKIFNENFHFSIWDGDINFCIAFTNVFIDFVLTRAAEIKDRERRERFLKNVLIDLSRFFDVDVLDKALEKKLTNVVDK